MDTLLVLISCFLHFAYAASNEHYRRFIKRQQDSSSLPSSSSSQPTQTLSSSATSSTPDHSLPATIQTKLPIHSSATPSGEVQTAIPVPPNSKPDNGPIIGFSIGIIVIAILLVATGWVLLTRYRQRKRQQTASRNLVQLQPTTPNNDVSSTTKRSFDDTRSSTSYT